MILVFFIFLFNVSFLLLLFFFVIHYSLKSYKPRMTAIILTNFKIHLNNVKFEVRVLLILKNIKIQNRKDNLIIQIILVLNYLSKSYLIIELKFVFEINS